MGQFCRCAAAMQIPPTFIIVKNCFEIFYLNCAPVPNWRSGELL
jgi:hypothetical protein